MIRCNYKCLFMGILFLNFKIREKPIIKFTSLINYWINFVFVNFFVSKIFHIEISCWWHCSGIFHYFYFYFYPSLFIWDWGAIFSAIKSFSVSWAHYAPIYYLFVCRWSLELRIGNLCQRFLKRSKWGENVNIKRVTCEWNLLQLIDSHL
jgi:hypothetical protein